MKKKRFINVSKSRDINVTQRINSRPMATQIEMQCRNMRVYPIHDFVAVQ